jgi:hypothetical protein
MPHVMRNLNGPCGGPAIGELLNRVWILYMTGDVKVLPLVFFLTRLNRQLCESISVGGAIVTGGRNSDDTSKTKRIFFF